MLWSPDRVFRELCFSRLGKYLYFIFTSPAKHWIHANSSGLSTILLIASSIHSVVAYKNDHVWKPSIERISTCYQVYFNSRMTCHFPIFDSQFSALAPVLYLCHWNKGQNVEPIYVTTNSILFIDKHVRTTLETKLAELFKLQLMKRLTWYKFLEDGWSPI